MRERRVSSKPKASHKNCPRVPDPCLNLENAPPTMQEPNCERQEGDKMQTTRRSNQMQSRQQEEKEEIKDATTWFKKYQDAQRKEAGRQLSLSIVVEDSA